ncbi:cathepsin F isoform X2 [Petaurus breviceps papuanus]|uniref:cathepsin F isoform X2 n=1 Tax=Petaurus breviceps papuanus TaxID=3040969 RepID=UPI0036DC59A4
MAAWLLLLPMLSSLLPGGDGWRLPLASDPALEAPAQFAMEVYNRGRDPGAAAVLQSVQGRSLKMAHGVLYSLEVTLHELPCSPATACKDPQSSGTLLCHFEVLDQMWAKQMLLKQDCGQPGEKREPCSGAQHLPWSSGHQPPIPPSQGDSVQLITLFKDFLTTYNKSYANATETQQRLGIFARNLELAQKMQELDQGSAEYGVTKFSDLTEEEFRTFYLNPLLSSLPGQALRPAPPAKGPAPTAWDWRDHGAVTEVKNQGMCGSCWAFSVTGNIEGQWFLRRGTLLALSEQELVDCDTLDHACGGGLPSNAYMAIERLGGLETEKDYGYEGHKEHCNFAPDKARAYINSSVDLSRDEEELAAWLAENGPISIALNAFAMQFYRRGVSHPFRPLCSPWFIDHAVLIVGYGNREGIPFWAIKNSWGRDWGLLLLISRGPGLWGECHGQLCHRGLESPQLLQIRPSSEPVSPSV